MASSLYAEGPDGAVFVGLAQYRAFVADRGFYLAAMIGAAWASLSAAATLLWAYPLAMLLRSSRRAWAVGFPLLVAAWATPVYIGAPLWRFLLHGVAGESAFKAISGLSLNLMTDRLGAFVATAFVSAWFRLPQATFLILAAAGRSRRAMDEAAALDGAGPAALAFSVRLPAMAGALAAVAAMELLSAFKEFTVPYLLTAGGPPLLMGVTERGVVGATTTLEIYLYDMFSSYADRGVLAAYSVALSTVMWVGAGLAFALRRRATAGRGAAGRSRPVLSSRPPAARGVGYVPGRAADLGFGAWSIGGALVLALSVAALAWCILWMAFSGLSVAFVDSFFPAYPSVEGFALSFGADGVMRNFMNTAWVSAWAALITVAVAFPAAAWLAERPASRTIMAFALLQALSSAGGVHSLIPLYELWRRTGLLGGYAPVVLIYVYHSAPTALLALATFLRDQPKSLRDAARLEGLGPTAWAARILLPLALPAIGAAAMLAFLSAWNGFLAPLIFLDDDSKYTIAIRLHSYVGSIASGAPKWNRFAAVSIANVALVGALFWRFKRPLSGSALAEHAED